MPELPEVERFRQLLLPLVDNDGDSSSSAIIQVRVLAPHRGISLEDDIIAFHHGCVDIDRRGKQLCLVFRQHKTLCLHMGMTGCIRVRNVVENWGHSGDLKDNNLADDDDEKKDEDNEDKDKEDASSPSSSLWPPKYAYLSITRNDKKYEAYFCDSRKFGKAFLVDQPADVLDILAPDALDSLHPNAWKPHHAHNHRPKDDNDKEKHEKIMIMADDTMVQRLAQQRLAVKALLLDQKRVVSGVGNW
jgi:formamidopyrimidine-DNA glycosylase